MVLDSYPGGIRKDSRCRRSKWTTPFSRIRNLRHENQYGFGPEPTEMEVASALENAGLFPERIRVLLKDK